MKSRPVVGLAVGLVLGLVAAYFVAPKPTQAAGMQGGGLSGSAGFNQGCAQMSSTAGNNVSVSVPQGQAIDFAGGTCGQAGNATVQFDGTNFRLDAGVVVSGPGTFNGNITLNNNVIEGQNSNNSFLNFVNTFAVQINSNLSSGNAAAGAIRIGNASTTLAGASDMIVVFYNGSAATVEAAIDKSGNIKTAGGPLPIGPFQHGVYQTLTNADTTLTAVGLPAPTLLANGGGTVADTTDTARNMVKMTTGAVSGNAGGVSGPFTTSAATRLPLPSFVIRTDPSAVTTVRYYVGEVKSSLDQIASLAAANAINNCTFRFDTGIGETTWIAESSDGTTASQSDTTIAVASATTYVLAIDDTVSGECDFYVNGVKKVAKSTNIPTDSTALGLESSVTTLTTAGRSISIGRVDLYQK